jgi:hypothetical protein
VEVDYNSLVSRADLHYDKPVDRSEDGMPLGNGRMGSLVWTTPSSLRFQINRVDVFANGCATDSFPERHTDYCGGCGFVDVEFADYGQAVFPGDGNHQRLSCYDGLATIEGKGVRARVLAWSDLRPGPRDVMAVEVTDRREQPGTIHVNLMMLRSPRVRTASHTATSRLSSRDGRIVLTQSFAEGDYYCGSAVAVGVIGRSVEGRQVHDMEGRLVVEPGRGPFTILIASAAGFDRNQDLAALALARLAAAVSEGFDGLAESNRAWWHDFWGRSFIHLHSEDGIADDVERHYTYYLYLMASSSRGRYPTKFNGMLWTTGGDTRRWGGQYWGANQSCLYNNALLAADHLDLLDPMFEMYSGMAASCSLAARQQWGSQGVFFPETVAFDGLASLPDEIATEMRDLYLLRRPWETKPQAFGTYAGTKQAYSSRWNWIGGGQWEKGRWVYTERGSGPYGPVTHIFSRGAKIAYQYWLRYEYSQDKTWLRDRAYPVIKGVAEFYRNYPNLKKEADSRYHIHYVNSNEPLWGGKDTDEEISSMMGILPVAIRASETLGVDAEMRPVWKDLLDNLAPLARSDSPGMAAPAGRDGPPVWIKGLEPIVRGRGSSLPDGNTMPMWFFDLCTLESDPNIQRIANATLEAMIPRDGQAGRGIGVLSKIGLAASVSGRADAVKVLVPGQIRTGQTPILANRMDLREGVQTTSAQRLGNAADALHNALCQSLPPGPGQPAVIRVFASWPGEWDAAFTLLCRGGFRVTSAMQEGKVEFVEVISPLGGECRLRNPWGDDEVMFFRNGKKVESLTGSLLRFDTAKGETLVVVPKGLTPSVVRIP